MLVTKENLPFIAHLLKRVIKKQFSVQYFYNTSVKSNRILKHFNIENKMFDFLYDVEESMFCTYRQITIKLVSYRSSILLYDNSPDQAGHFIEIGDSITFNRNLIIHKTKHPTKKDKCICKITNFY